MSFQNSRTPAFAFGASLQDALRFPESCMTQTSSSNAMKYWFMSNPKKNLRVYENGSRRINQRLGGYGPERMDARRVGQDLPHRRSLVSCPE